MNRHDKYLQQKRQQRRARNSVDGFGKGFGIAAFFIVLLNIAWVGFLIWAIWKLVTHFTGG